MPVLVEIFEALGDLAMQERICGITMSDLPVEHMQAFVILITMENWSLSNMARLPGITVQAGVAWAPQPAVARPRRADAGVCAGPYRDGRRRHGIR